ncbi:hypothetical protein F3Y22_tig00110678pilonHSYRG00056 [Hibiscus syriacus]|uniref:Uncharacterized protein n=1 Tax=Hibiscus syriacus TaxID=106335 RepID=A0A6A2ZYC5_HIBSY|nr:uncharacterized protein At1g76070-like [Hibiscus syriacus]KAE8695885.1 hypothetical protein F3Y22_tig00110678pilonHSYRG00056 [Hibiscus syriacus]
MEKLVTKHKKIPSAFLPKAALSSVLSSQVSPPISPVGKASSSSSSTIVVSLIPKDAPRKSKNGSFDAREPALPKVSCMGQIKSKKKKKKQGATKSKVASASPPPQAIVAEEVENKGALIKETKRGDKASVSDSQAKIAEATRVLSLGMMKQFSSTRGSLSDFDWACDAAPGIVTNPLYEEKGGRKEKVNDNGVVVEETRKAKLWNRRTTTRLTPIVNSITVRVLRLVIP